MNGFNFLYVNKLVDSYQKANRKVTIEDIANLIGISKASLDNIRKGVSENPNIETLYKIAIFFGVTINDFIDGMRTDNNNENELHEPLPEYKVSQDSVDGWKKAFELQQELTEVKLELERIKNVNAPTKSALVG